MDGSGGGALIKDTNHNALYVLKALDGCAFACLLSQSPSKYTYMERQKKKKVEC